MLGPFLSAPAGARVRRLAQSRNVWDRRMAVLATSYEIREGRYRPTFDLAAALIDDDHDLIHKAVGWMLREIGKRDLAAECRFLDQHAARMPRTMLRYAVERFPPALRGRYMRRGKPRSR
jgi:3-methyladenine DNA glycosylase AlkD